MPVNCADLAKEQSAATFAQPKRMSAGHPRRPAARPAERNEDVVHAVLGAFLFAQYYFYVIEISLAI